VAEFQESITAFDDAVMARAVGAVGGVLVRGVAFRHSWETSVPFVHPVRRKSRRPSWS
jgi:hypothetical protein